ncbi:MAG TPA: dienelactone hydrolase family protein [Verrucomicrobiae bacterium]|nr:dienelactone hydrolase family protein [Verrucomicrobiae bacterium]
MKALLLSIVICLFAVSAVAAEPRDVTYQSGDETVHALLYMPAGEGPFPALVVIHEWWGLNDWVKQQASDYADKGYIALAIDLYRGKVATTPDEAHQIMRGVPEDRAQRDLLAATTFLRSLNTVNGKKVGAIGWCMGGGYALDLAIADPKLKAVVINYGHLATEKSNLRKIHASVLGLFGGEDQGIPVADIRKFETELQGMNKKVEIHIYPDAGHAFENPNNEKGYRADDAANAQKLTAEFLQKNLK